MNFVTTVYTVMFFFGIYFLLLFIILYLRNKKELEDYPKPKRFPKVSFIIAAYNEEDSITDTIKALLKIEYPKEKKEIIIINDGSKDKTREIIQSFSEKHSEIKIINKENSGKADSLNKGIKIATGELIAVVDADSYPEKDSLNKMVGYFEDRQVAAVTSRVLVKNTKNFIERYQDFDYNVIAWTRKLLDFIGSVYVTNGPLSVYRRDLVVKAGGFDPKNMTEDIEITWNLLSKGYKTKMSYSTKVYTTVPKTLNHWIKQRVRWNLGGLQTLFKYKKFFLRGENLFGYFVMSYVSLSFFLSLIGIFLILRLFYIKFGNFLWSVPYIFQGYNPFQFFEINFFVTILIILAMMFFIFSFIYYKFSLRNSEIKNKKLRHIITYTFIYRPLYLLPLIISIYKLAKGEIGWYTK